MFVADWLIDEMAPSSLKDELMSCASDLDVMQVSDFSIGHRGACMQFPEHTIDSYKAAIRMGAGIIECDVTFTADLELVCRHAQVSKNWFYFRKKNRFSFPCSRLPCFSLLSY